MWKTLKMRFFRVFSKLNEKKLMLLWILGGLLILVAAIAIWQNPSLPQAVFISFLAGGLCGALIVFYLFNFLNYTTDRQIIDQQVLIARRLFKDKYELDVTLKNQSNEVQRLQNMGALRLLARFENNKIYVDWLTYSDPLTHELDRREQNVFCYDNIEDFLDKFSIIDS